MNAFSSADSFAIRVLSPRIDPPERREVGSTASTATLLPSPVSSVPKASMKVDLPTPGTPVMPMRCALPVSGMISDNSARASVLWSPRRDSTRVMARPSPARVKRSGFKRIRCEAGYV